MSRPTSRSNHRPPASRDAPDACVARLSLYVRELRRLGEPPGPTVAVAGAGRSASRARRGGQRAAFVSSRRLAQLLGLTDAQVRRDLSYFGQFGTSGRGYDVQRLHERLTAILGVSGRTWNVALAGVGNLGSALLAYRGFRERGFLFKAAVDTDPRKTGRTVQGLTVASSQQLVELVTQEDIHIGMIAVPVEAAQEVCDQFVHSGVRAIVNFAPVHLDVPESVWLRVVDLAIELESLAYYLARSQT
ncbi:MAG: redox-sensing transcriptional repressor Rex [Candidatus Omnitrophica bacterium]|nr:redox-sensing transcriptional repressor Rex [Candidatus Omnitrophota bacterium]